ncbi:MAG: ligase-associated DNA damage response DEXH box helicase [Burkholderiaceae bacterium]
MLDSSVTRFATTRFKQLGLSPLPFQKDVWKAMDFQSCGLVHAPTGFGKTYAVWAGVLGQLLSAEREGSEPARAGGLQVLWITPMRALATDSLDALRRFAPDDFSLGLRTGDTSSAERTKQERRPPRALVTTPESLSLMLSKPQGLGVLKGLRFVVVDEWHELIGNKRGSLLELSLAALASITNRRLQVWGLSATLGNPDEAARVLCHSLGSPVTISASGRRPPRIKTLLPKDAVRFAWSGHLGLTMLEPVLAQIEKVGSSLLFTNTRSQAELWYQAILQARPDWAGQMALHHGSLDAQTRAWVERATAAGELRVVVATSSLDLGVDFAPVEQVFQLGSPKGVARLLQRAGRSGHQPKGVSSLYMVPTHGFEILESLAAQQAIDEGFIEPRSPLKHPLDVLAQHLVTRILGQPMTEQELFNEVRQSYSFKNITIEYFNWTLNFLSQGGASLKAYPDFHRIHRDVEGRWQMQDQRLARRHRQSIGTIVSDASIRLVWLSGGGLGQVEESFLGRLKPGDTFLFAGRSLELVRVRDLTAYVRKASGKAKAVARWTGGSLPLSGELASCLRSLLDAFASDDPSNPRTKTAEAKSLQPLLRTQAERSAIPTKSCCLVEHFVSKDGEHCFIYPFAGRQVHIGLASLLAFRLTRGHATSLSYAANDYGFELLAPRRRKSEGPWLSAVLSKEGLPQLLQAKDLSRDLLALLGEGLITRRRFREIARVAGLLVMGLPGAGRSSRQLAVSSNLLFEVFTKYDPENLLLQQAQREALEQELCQSALESHLQRLLEGRWLHCQLKRPSPFCVPLMVERLREQLSSERLSDRLARLAAEFEDA